MSNTIDDSFYSKYGIQQTTTAASNELGQEDFMTLMLAQLKYQDPLSPQDNGEFIAQMASFSTASGIQELQSSIDNMVSSLQSNQALQASTLVGRTVLVPGDSGWLPAEEGSMGGLIEVPASTSGLTVKVYDASGALVREVDLGQQAAGDAYFLWDGENNAGERMDEGLYSIEAIAQYDGKNVQLDTQMASVVQSVSITSLGQTPTLNLLGMGPVSMSEVKQIM